MEKATLEYLEEMYFLSQCDAFVTGMNSGVVCVNLWNRGRFEDVCLLDLGKQTGNK